MSETGTSTAAPAAPDGNDDGGTTSTAPDTFTPITTQSDLDALIASRLERERAKYADYKDLKAKASRLDEIEAANKSELEKATDLAAAAEKERDDARAEALRLRVAVEHSISIEDADLFLTGRDEETLRAQAGRLVAREAERKKSGGYVPKEGASTEPPALNSNQLEADLKRALGVG